MIICSPENQKVGNQRTENQRFMFIYTTGGSVGTTRGSVGTTRTYPFEVVRTFMKQEIPSYRRWSSLCYQVFKIFRIRECS